jgi:hypothetical protein
MSSIFADNSALVYEPKCGGKGVIAGSQPRVRLYTGAQINFGDLTPYLTYAPHTQHRKSGTQGKVPDIIWPRKHRFSIRSYAGCLISFQISSCFLQNKLYLSFREHCTSHCVREGTSAGCQRLVGQRSGP